MEAREQLQRIVTDYAASPRPVSADGQVVVECRRCGARGLQRPGEATWCTHGGAWVLMRPVGGRRW